MPYLQDIEPEDRPDVQLAVDLLGILRGSQRTGIKIGHDDLTAMEFELVSYLSAHIDSVGSKGK